MRSARIMTMVLVVSGLITTACSHGQDPGRETDATGTPESGASTDTGSSPPTTTTGDGSSSTAPTTAIAETSTSDDTGEPGSGTTTELDTSSGTTGDSGSTGVDIPPPEATTLTLEILPIKRFSFSWPAAAGATYYQIHERPTPGDAYTQVGDDLLGTTKDLFVPLHLRSSASYFVRACNDGGCTDSAPVAVADSLAKAVGYFKATNGKAGFYFGESVALSADGTTMVVGAPLEDGASTGINGNQANLSAPDAGAAYVFVADNGAWAPQAYIKASNTAAGDRFGYSVSLSADGDTLAVGALFEDSAATGVNGSQNDGAGESGAVYVFKRNGGTWLQQAYIKASNTRTGAMFGLSVELAGDGDTLAVGTENEASSATGVNGNQADTSAPNAGAVYVFTSTNGSWSQQAYVKASNTNAGDFFGHSLGLSHDGDTLAVSALFEASNATGINGIQSDNSASKAGAVYVFQRANNVWAQQAYIKASNTASADEFGGQIDLSADGAVLAVGAIHENSAATGINGNQSDNSLGGAGAVYVFSRENNLWSQEAYIKASNTGATDHFGYGIALSGNGKMLVTSAAQEDSSSSGVGQDADNNGAVDSGALYVFVRDAQTWSQRSYVKASNTSAGFRHGDSVALSADGSTLATGTIYETSAAQGIGGAQNDKSAALAGVVYVY